MVAKQMLPPKGPFIHGLPDFFPNASTGWYLFPPTYIPLLRDTKDVKSTLMYLKLLLLH